MRRITLIPSKDMDRRDYELFKRIGMGQGQVNAGLGNIARGQSPSGGGFPIPALDDSRFVLLAGRPEGQIIKGSDRVLGTSGITKLLLMAYASDTAANILLNNRSITLEMDTLTLRAPEHTDEPLLMGFSTSGSPVQNWCGLTLTGNILINASSASTNGFALNHGNMPTTNVTAFVQKRSAQTGNLFEWRASGVPMSYIRASDGAFVGPAAITEPSGFLLLAGASGGQHIGAGTKPTGGNTDDISMFGRLYLGDSVGGTLNTPVGAYVANRVLSLKKDVDNSSLGSATLGYSNFFFNLAPTGTVAAGTHTLAEFEFTGGAGTTSGSYALILIQAMGALTVPAGTTASVIGFKFDPSILGTGTLTSLIGLNAFVTGSTNAGAVVTTLVGVKAEVSNTAATCTNLLGFQASNAAGFSISAAVTQATAYDVGGGFANDADVVTWSGLRISTGITAAIANKWSLDLTNTSTNMGSRIAHKMGLGWNPATVSAITSRVMLAAGATGAGTSPLKFQSGSLNTTPEAGAIEFLTDDFFLTISTGAARKAFVLDDGTRLTAGRVPFATTNGRLTDDADMTFATDTLTVTKLVASTSILVGAGAAITELERTASGVYTPTLTNVANLAASTAYQCQWMRVGSVVTVSGKVDVDPTLATTSTQLGISLPIASNIGAAEDVGGVAAAPGIAGQAAAILGDATNDRAQMQWVSGDITNQPMYFSFTYRII